MKTLKQIQEEILREFDSMDIDKPSGAIREGLNWYWNNGKDHGDLVIAEEDIIRVVKQFLLHATSSLAEAMAREMEIEKRINAMIKNPLLTKHGKKAGTEAELDSLKRYYINRLKEFLGK